MTSLTQDYVVFQDDQGNDHAKLSQRKVGELLKVADTTIMRALRKGELKLSNSIENLLKDGFIESDIEKLAVWFAGSKKVSNKARQACIEYLASRGYPTRIIQKVKNDKVKESFYRDRLQRIEGGLIEVITPVGNIDLLTDTDIIEIKKAENWKNALGQILVYGYYYPNHQKRIHLIINLKSIDINFQKKVKKHCAIFDIKVTWEPEHKES